MREPRIGIVTLSLAVCLAAACNKRGTVLIAAPVDRAATPLVHPTIEPFKYEWVGNSETGTGDPSEPPGEEEPEDGSPECTGAKGCWTEARWPVDGGGTLAIIRRSLVAESRCRPAQVWFSRGAERRNLLTFCNDGYGASGVGTDELSLIGNELTYRRYGGSASRWENTTSFTLAPFTARRTHSEGYYMTTQTHAARWDWTTQSGASLHRDPDGTATAAGTQTWSVNIPTLGLPARFAETGWATLAWTCGSAGGLGAGDTDPEPLGEDESIDESFLDGTTKAPLVAFRSEVGTLFVTARGVRKTDNPTLELFEAEAVGNTPRTWVVAPASAITSGSSPQLTVKSVYPNDGWRVQVPLPKDVAGVGLRLRTTNETWRTGSIVNGRVHAAAWHDVAGARCVEEHGRLVAKPIGCPSSTEACPEGEE